MISIVMPAKNAAPFLSECLQSIINQSFEIWELIVINDHSTDQTREILELNSTKDPRIKWFDAEGVGIIQALRQAYRHTSGSYVTRMDADDIMSQTKLEEMLEVLTQKGAGHVAIGLVSYFSDSTLGDGYKKYAQWLNGLTMTQTNYTQIYKECVIPSPCWMCAKEDFDKSGGFSEDVYPEDYDLCFRFRNAGLQIAAVPKVLHYWRDHQTRASRNDPNYKDNSFINLKIKHFVETDLNSDSTTIVWGAGRKGKRIIQQLLVHEKDVKWICDNPNKIGKDIYGVFVQDDKSIESILKAQVIVAVANPEEQRPIREYLMKKTQLEPFFFC